MIETLSEVLDALEKARRNLYRESEEAGQVGLFGAPAAAPEPAPVAPAPNNMGQLAALRDDPQDGRNMSAVTALSRRQSIDQLDAFVSQISRSARSDIFDTPMNPMEAAFETGYKAAESKSIDRKRDALAAKDPRYRDYRDSLQRLQREAAARKREIRSSDTFTKMGGIALIGNTRQYDQALDYVHRVERSTYGEILTRRPGK